MGTTANALLLVASLLLADTLSDALKAFASAKGSEDRMAALTAVVEAGAGDAAAAEDDRRVAGAVASALGDEDVSLRAHALGLLSPELGGDAIEGALTDLCASFGAERTLALTGPTTRLPEPERVDGVSEEQLEKLAELAAELDVMAERLKRFQAFQTALIETARQRRGPQRVARLGHLADALVFSEDGSSIMDDLFAEDSIEAYGELVGVFAEVDRVTKERVAARRKLAKEARKAPPRGFKGDKTLWRERQKASVARMLTRFDEATGELERWASAHGERLRRTAEARSYGQPPTSDEPRRWRQWWCATAKRLETQRQDAQDAGEPDRR